jgi:hypothetical protein
MAADDRKVRRDNGLQVRVALIGVLGALLGAVVGGAVAIIVQRDQLNEQRQEAARVQRAGVYSGFLDAADQWSGAVSSVFDTCPREIIEARKKGRKPSCRFNIKGFDSARSGFQNAINAVYVYGSYRAVAASKAVAMTLPSTADIRLQRLTLAPVNVAKFASAWNNFQRIMCQEASAEPRANC